MLLMQVNRDSQATWTHTHTTHNFGSTVDNRLYSGRDNQTGTLALMGLYGTLPTRMIHNNNDDDADAGGSSYRARAAST